MPSCWLLFPQDCTVSNSIPRPLLESVNTVIDIGISIGYLYLMMGVIISSAVLPAALTLLWSQQNMIAATLSPILGLMCSLIAWLVTAKRQYGDLSVASTGSNNPMLAGNVVALLSPLIFVPVLTYAFGQQNYDYRSMALIRLGDDSDVAALADVDLELIPGAIGATEEETAVERAKLKRASIIAKTMTGVLTVALLIVSRSCSPSCSLETSYVRSVHLPYSPTVHFNSYANSTNSFGPCLCTAVGMCSVRSSLLDGCL